MFYVLINHDQKAVAYITGLNMLVKKFLGFNQIVIWTCYPLTFPPQMSKPLLMVGFRKNDWRFDHHKILVIIYQVVHVLRMYLLIVWWKIRKLKKQVGRHVFYCSYLMGFLAVNQVLMGNPPFSSWFYSALLKFYVVYFLTYSFN